MTQAKPSAAQPIQIQIVEDDQPTRFHLAQVLATAPDLRLTAQSASVREAVIALASHPADVLLTDIGLPDGSGLDLIRLARRAHPKLEIMVISVFGDQQHLLRAIEAGATGYLLKDMAAAQICDAIRQLTAGGSPISPGIARHLLRRLKPIGVERDTGQGGGISLTPRETLVLQQIAKGFSYDEVAASLDMSVHTVTTHIKHLYRKLSVRSRGEAVFEAVQLGLISVG